jgi:hypothetical protein
LNPLIGRTVKDQITGFEGVVTGRAEYITGCAQLLVQPKMRANSFVEPRWIDEDRCDVSTRERIGVTIKNPGPDKPAPIR